ncbi:MAG: integrase [Ahrensia sp.]|nr:integrase [Ahrensia sp.]MBV48201.1 integrase [Roseobacter sp.]MBV48302.1 integrase [Roseobacter sp.]
MRVVLEGIHKVKAKLAGGKQKYYLYAWRGGPLLSDADGNALQPGDKRIAKAYADAHEADKKKNDDTLRTLIDEFRRSTEYTEKADKTRRGYDLYLGRIESAAIADMPIEAVQDPSARGSFKAWRDTMADKPRSADYAWVTLARVLSVAKDNGRIAVNVCERGGRLYKANRSEIIWEEDHIAAMMKAARRPLQMALMLGLWTGQREGDLLRVAWNAYDGKSLRIKQGKTGARVTIPVGETLRQMLDAAPRVSTSILTNTRNKPWTEDGFRASWATAYRNSGLPMAKGEKLHFHDLRGTAVTRLALAGCSNSQIAAITGHSLRDVEAILDTHYLGGRVELAEQAMLKLEQHARKVV